MAARNRAFWHYLEHSSADTHRLTIFPPARGALFGKASPIPMGWCGFLRHERSHTIPRIGRAFAAILPDFPTKHDL
jgi:hypothetical protein